MLPSISAKNHNSDKKSNEYDHVFMGISNELPLPNPTEVAGFRYMDTDLLIFELFEQPHQYTAWFKICLEKVLEIYYQNV